MADDYIPRRTPVHPALLFVKTIGGVEFRIAVLNFTMGLAVVAGSKSLLFLAITIPLHIFLRWVTKKDPHAVRIYMRYRLFGSIYDPWVKRSTTMNDRPRGFSRGMLC